MLPPDGSPIIVRHRQNRRRERPGSRTRRTITRRSILRQDFDEGLVDAFDAGVSLPSDNSTVSPLLRHNFDKSWQRWKARQATEDDEAVRAAREMDAKRERLLAELESEQLRLFGGDIDDDELHRMGILYRIDEDPLPHANDDPHIVSRDVPIENTPPLFIIRHRKLKHSRRRLASRLSIPLCCSSSPLISDEEMAHFFSTQEFASRSALSTIQHRIERVPDQAAEDLDLVSSQSLPPVAVPLSALAQLPITPAPLPGLSLSHIITVAHISPSTQTRPLELPDFRSSSPTPSFHDWTFISPAPSPSIAQSDLNLDLNLTSDPWILLSDDS